MFNTELKTETGRDKSTSTRLHAGTVASHLSDTVFSHTKKNGTALILLTCDQVLFSFRSVKHSGAKGETKNRA